MPYQLRLFDGQEQPADLFQRVVAFIIDLMVVLFVAFATNRHIGTLFFTFYMLFRDSFPLMNGRSIGKLLLGIRVIVFDRDHKLSKDPLRGALRNLFLLIPIINLADLAFLLSPTRKRLGDVLARTMVVMG